MKKLIEIIFLIIVIILGVVYKDTLINAWIQTFHKYLPCKQPIYYSIGTFDTRFGISKEQFIQDLASAEKVWEDPIQRDLFKYSPNGNLKINLIYDSRQKTTDELNNIDSSLDSSRDSYNKLNTEYKARVLAYNKKSVDFESRLNDFNTRKRKYESEVLKFNRQNSISDTIRDRLNAEKEALDKESIVLNQLQGELNKEVGVLNQMVSNINKIATDVNIGVEQYNTIGEPLADGFNEGLYKSSIRGQEIDIYQFDDDTKLIRVLAHEFGHALNLDHVDDPEAIMYKLNTSTNIKLTNSDLSELKRGCGLK